MSQRFLLYKWKIRLNEIIKLSQEKLEEKIEQLLKEKEVISKEIKKTRLENLAVGLEQEKEELEERLEILAKEKEDVINHLEIVGIIGELKCPKNFQCYERKYAELCPAEFVGETKVLHCFDNKPGECIFSLSYEDKYYCQCPLRNYIAENIGK